MRDLAGACSGGKFVESSEKRRMIDEQKIQIGNSLYVMCKLVYLPTLRGLRISRTTNHNLLILR
jgi:hypothetical protein